MPSTILVVEDEETSAGVIKEALELEQFQIVWAPSLFRARSALNKTSPDLIILDRRLPDGDGLELCRELKAKAEWKDVPILFLSAKKAVTDRVSGLNMGGDDYLAKPFDIEELLARVRALVRRRGSAEAPRQVLQADELRLDLQRVEASYKGKPLKLWPKEFELLRVLVERKGRVVSREALLQSVWGYDKDLEITSKTVDVTVSRLRKKLGAYADRLIFIKGYGYRFDDSASRLSR